MTARDEQAAVQELLVRAVELEGAEREAFLSAACAGAEALRAEVESLLASLDRDMRFMADPTDEEGAALSGIARASPSWSDNTVSTTGDDDGPATPGARIGRYKLLRRIGEGGFGTVYLAEQEHPVRRRVALKLVKLGMDTGQIIARFEAERQALALMDHPNIAQVFDAGATESGRPYFVMELVKGVPITEYCDTQGLSLRDRLELFVPVCRAVQHAHQKGVIHRDIKPGNVLVMMTDGTPVPKVIDFGIAKATQQRLTERTIVTELRQFIGTPQYMSPEQAEMTGIDIDTRSDVYSLGVVLYELLTGTTPFDPRELRGLSYDDLRRMIREVEPVRPSVRLARDAAAGHGVAPDAGPREPAAPDAGAPRRRSDRRALARAVRGDLDWIVMKCLEKDRTRRYATAEELATELGRYLADQPVSACPPSPAYRLRKFARRNRPALTAAALVLASVIAVGGAAAWVARDRHLRRGDTERRVTEALDAAQRFAEQGKWPESRAATERAEGLLAGRPTDPLLQLRTREHLADLDMVATLEEIRLELADGGHAGQADAGGDDSALARYAFAFARYGVNVLSLEPKEAARRLGRRPVRLHLATALDYWAHLEEGDTRRRVLAAARATDPDPWRNRVRDAWERQDRDALVDLAARDEVRELPPQSLALLGHYLETLGAHAQANDVLRVALRRHPSDFWTNYWLGAALAETTRAGADEAVTYLRAAVVLRPQSPRARVTLGDAMRHADKTAEAEAEYRAAMRLDPGYIPAHVRLSQLLDARGERAEAEQAVRNATASAPKTVASFMRLGDAFFHLGNLSEAVAQYQAAMSLNPHDAVPHYRLGTALQHLGKADEAERELRRALELKPDFADAHAHLAAGLNNARRYVDAEKHLRAAIRSAPQYVNAHVMLGRALAGQRKRPDAEREFREAVRLDARSAAEFGAHRELVELLVLRGDVDDAVNTAREAVRLNPEDARARADLGVMLSRSDRHGDAENELREALRLKPNSAEVHLAMGLVLSGKGDPSGAEREYREAVRLAPNYGEAHNNLGLALARRGDIDGAETEYREAIRANPHLYQPHYNLGRIFADRLNDRARAEASFRDAIRVYPEYGSAHAHLGALFEAQERIDDAMAEYRAAVRGEFSESPDADEHMAHCRLAKLLSRRRQFDRALTHFREAIRTDPQCKTSRPGLAHALENLGRRADAIAEYREVIRADPDAHQAHCSLALLLQQDDDDIDAAIAAFREAIRTGPKCVTSNQGLAWLLCTSPDPKHRDPAAALEAVKKALEVTPDNGRFWNILGVAQYRCGDYAAAIEALERSRQMTGGERSENYYFLAMAYWQHGQRDTARGWYDRAHRWVEEHGANDHALRRIATEAAAMIAAESD